MKFKHADRVSVMRVEALFSVAKISCMIGCMLIAAMGHINTVFYGPLPSVAHTADGLSHSSGTGSANLNGTSNPLPTEAFFDSEEKTNPFLLLLAFREVSAGIQIPLYPFCFTDAHLSGRFAQKAPNIYFTLIRCSTPLRC
jgi:hypothetical protein